MSTPHLAAAPGQFADTVLLPGDPLRAKHIADTILEDAEQVTGVRNMLGFTGTYRGMGVSVLGTGMGIPSASIYATELVTHYDVKRMVRVGSCGSLQPDVKLREVLLAAGACTDSGVNRARYAGLDFAAIADFDLLRHAHAAASDAGVDIAVGNVHSADLFYEPRDGLFDTMRSMGVLAVEMEAAGLYGVAAAHGVRALAILTVSDVLATSEHLDAADRETSFDEMVHIALDGLYRDTDADQEA